MKSLHLKKLAGVGEKVRAWGKSDKEDRPGEGHDGTPGHHHRRSRRHRHGRRSHSPSPSPRAISSPSPEADAIFSDDDLGGHHRPDGWGSPAAHRHGPSSTSSMSSSGSGDERASQALVAPSGREAEGTVPTETHGEPYQVSLLDDSILLPSLPPLPVSARRRGSLPELGRREDISAPTPPDLLTLLEEDGHRHHDHQPMQHGEPPAIHPSEPPPLPPRRHAARPQHHGPRREANGVAKLKEKVHRLKLREAGLKEESHRERHMRKEAEKQIQAMQKERYLQGLKIKYLEAKLEKKGTETDMEKRVKHEGRVNVGLKKEVEGLAVNLADKEKALAEKEEQLAKLKRKYKLLKHGGSDESTLDELETIEQVLEKGRNELLERIKRRLKEEVDDKVKCLICCDRSKAIIFVPCGHRVCCVECSQAVKTCPICRADIKIRQKVFE